MMNAANVARKGKPGVESQSSVLEHGGVGKPAAPGYGNRTRAGKQDVIRFIQSHTPEGCKPNFRRLAHLALALGFRSHKTGVGDVELGFSHMWRRYKRGQIRLDDK